MVATQLEGSLDSKAAQEKLHWSLMLSVGIGPSRADQLLVDLCGVFKAPVVYLSVGRGSRRGLCWLEGLHMGAIEGPQAFFLRALEKIHVKLNKGLQKRHQPLLRDLGDTAHFMCELDKRFRSTGSCDERAVWGAQPYCRYRESTRSKK
jgi:hypothetical protein